MGRMAGSPGSIPRAAGNCFSSCRFSPTGDSYIRDGSFASVARLDPPLLEHLGSPPRAPCFSTAPLGGWHSTAWLIYQPAEPNEGYEVHYTLGLFCPHFPGLPGHRS